MGKITNYKDLQVWQRGMTLVETIYKLTSNLPPSEQWGLVTQMRRAVVSVPSNIAEGYGRQSTGQYRQYLSISRGSLLELETQVILCRRLGLIGNQEAEGVQDEIAQINRMLSSLISKLS